METAMTDTLETGARSAEKRSVSSQIFPGDKTAPRAATSWLRSLPTGLSESRLADAELCLDELVTNIVRYAWSDGGAHTLTVSVERAGGEVEIAVEDDGLAFDPTAAPLAPIPHTLDEAVPGGRGLLLVRSIAPKLRYERRGDVNRVAIAFPL
jgi:anti-sigma regulatory factor (Ser/Thr protein kinase)